MSTVTDRYSTSRGLAGRHELSTAAGKIEAYIFSMYIVTQTLTTIGYGDTGGQSTYERVCYIFFFIAGAFVWGSLLAKVQVVLFFLWLRGHGGGRARLRREEEERV